MLSRGLAYHCYMSPEELDALRAAQMARGEKPRYDGRWRPENAVGMTPPAGVAPVIRFKNPLAGTVAWDDAVKGRIEISQYGARRSRDRAPGRHADLQLLRGRRRPRHAHHARDPRRRSRQQHAAPDQHPARAGRVASRLCASADRAHARGRETFQAAWREGRAAVQGRRLFAGGGRQLPGAARMGAWRRRDLHARAIRRLVRSRGPVVRAGPLRSRKIEVGESRTPEANVRERARSAVRSLPRCGKTRSGGGSRAGSVAMLLRDRVATLRRDGRRSALLLCDAAPGGREDRGVRQRRQSTRARTTRGGPRKHRMATRAHPHGDQGQCFKTWLESRRRS